MPEETKTIDNIRNGELMCRQWLNLKNTSQVTDSSTTSICISARVRHLVGCLAITALVSFTETRALNAMDYALQPIVMETVSGEGIWIDPKLRALTQNDNSETGVRANQQQLTVKVWFDRQLLGTGDAYRRRSMELSGAGRKQLRLDVVKALQNLSDSSHAKAAKALNRLEAEGFISHMNPHWIINGFTCNTTPGGITKLKSVPGVKKIFSAPQSAKRQGDLQRAIPQPNETSRKPHSHYKHPWYIRSLQADRVWSDFQIQGDGTLNVIADGNFAISPNLAVSVYRNPTEIPDNQIDDDDNGYVDDCHGYNFTDLTNRITVTRSPRSTFSRTLHGAMCATIICGNGTQESPYEFGIAPEAKWAGVIGGLFHLENAVEWAVLQNADTYSMSFSHPKLGEYRSHVRKIFEHGAFCGIFFVSGAGNFAQTTRVPEQMRSPEDTPEVVFAAAGVQRDLSRTLFSSQGPVRWDTEHYQDGMVRKPEVCAFNQDLPCQLPDGKVIEVQISGNSFAGPMFCGTIALMLSADPELLPWDCREIITQTATDVGDPGYDYQTGHGLINCHAAVKEVLRRKALRNGKNASQYAPSGTQDTTDHRQAARTQAKPALTVTAVRPQSPAAAQGVLPGDTVISMNNQPINNRKDYDSTRQKANGKPVTLVLQRGEKQRSYQVPPIAWGLSLGMRAGTVFE
jgi:subtilisin family serine protease